MKLQAYRQLTVERRKSVKLSPRYFGLYEVIARVESIAYTLRLPEGSKVHPTFQVSLLKKCPDPSIVPVHLPNDVGLLDDKRQPAEILERRIVQKKGTAVKKVLVRWQGEASDEASWELWYELHTEFPWVAKEVHPWGQGCSFVGGGRNYMD